MITRPRFLAAVIAVLLLAAATRILNAGSWPVWTDEGYSLYVISEPGLDNIIARLTEDFHPPLYLVLLSGWHDLTGDSRLALRMLTILGGVLATAVVYRTGRDAFGHRAGLYGALIFAVLDVTVHYSQQIRQYGWLVTTVALASLFFLRALQKPSLPRLAAYVLVLAAALYTLYLSFVIWAVQVFVALFLWRRPIRQKVGMIAAWLAAGLLYLPWIVGFRHIWTLLSEGGIGSRPNVSPTTTDAVLGLLDVLFSGQTALFLGLFGLGAWALARMNWRHPCAAARYYVFLAGWGLLVLMIAGNVWVRVLTPRTLVYLMPAIVLLCGYGLATLSRRAALLLTAAMLLVVVPANPTIQPRLDYRLASSALAENYSDGDLIVLETGWDDNAFAYEIDLALPGQPQIIRTLPFVDTRAELRPVVPEIEADLEAARRVWVVNWLQPSQVTPFLEAGNLGFRPALSREVSVGSEYRNQFGDNTVTVALYEQVDDAASIDFGDALALRSVTAPGAGQAGTRVFVDLWWMARRALDRDYSVGVYLLDEAGIVVAQHDGPPGALPTSQWAGDMLLFDRHPLALAPDLPAGRYRIAVKAYWYVDLTPLRVDNNEYAVIGELDVSF